MTSRQRTILIVLAEMALAAVLIFPGLGEASYWLDEAGSVAYAIAPHDYWTVGVHGDTNMWLYYALLQPWVLVSGGEAWVRALSALFAMACIPVTVRIGTALISKKAGLLSGLLLAVHPFLIHYGREARGYTLLMLLGLCATLAYVRVMQSSSLRRGMAYGLFVLLGMCAHGLAVFNAISHAIALLVVPRRRIPWAPFFAAVGLVIMGILLLFLLMRPNDRDYLSWLTKPSWSVLVATCRELGGCSLALVAFYGLVLAFGAGFWLAAWRRPDGWQERWTWSLLLAGVLVPVVIAFAWSQCVSPMFTARYVATTVPALALCAGAVLGRLRRPAVFLAAVFLVGFGTVAAFRENCVPSPWEDWRGLTRHIRNESRAGDAVICHALYLVMPVRVYTRLQGAIPADIIDMYSMIQTSDGQQAPSLRLIRKLSSRYSRIWLASGHNIFSHLGSTEKKAKLLTHLQRYFVPVSVSQYGAITLILWERHAHANGDGKQGPFVAR